MTAFKGEQVFTSTLLDLAEDRKGRILFTTGHGELGLDDGSAAGLDQAQDLLGRDNFEIEEWASLGQPSVPEGTDLVVVAGPTSDFVAPELDVLDGYLEGGGRLLVLADPALDRGPGKGLPGLSELLSRHGIVLGDDVVIDPANPLPFYGAETIFVTAYGDHPITRALGQTQTPVILPLGRSVRSGEAVSGFSAVELLETSSEGWGERDLERLDRIERDENDLGGPVPLGVAVAAAADGGPQVSAEVAPAETTAASADPEPGARLVVIGDSDFATNAQLANVGNAELLASAVNWLVARESLVGIPAKEPEQVRLALSSSELRRLAWIVFGLLPGLALVGGVAVHLRRRR